MERRQRGLALAGRSCTCRWVSSVHCSDACCSERARPTGSVRRWWSAAHRHLVSAPGVIARGNVALATVLNAVNTALAPLLVPVLFVALTGVGLTVPVTKLMGELLLVILVPTVLGVWLRTRFSDRLSPAEPLLSATGSIVYLVLLLAVLGPNAQTILDSGWDLALLVAGALLLNLIGYAFGATVRPWLHDRIDRIALLFTVSKKEFSIAAVVVGGSGVPPEVAAPAVVTAVVQMITSPIAARWLSARAPVS